MVADPDTRAFVRRVLEERYRLELVSNEHAALEAIGRQVPALVLITGLVPPPDELRLLRTLRSRDSTSGMPVVLLGTRDEEEWRTQVYQAGADDYLIMPVSPRELLARLGCRLELSRIRTDAAIREHEASAPDDRSPDLIRAAEARFRTFMSQSRDGIIIIDSQGTVLEWNEGEEKITGIPRAEAVSRPLWEVQYRLAPEEQKTTERLRLLRDVMLGALNEGTELERTIEEEIQRPDGTRRIIESKVFAVRSGGNLLAGGITRDITERRRLEDDRREAQALLLEAERLVHLGHFARDLRTGKAVWSDEVYRILGHAPGSFAPEREALLAAIAPEDRQLIAEGLNATARDGVPRTEEFRIITPQGAVRTVFASVELLRDAHGAPARILGTVQDITGRKQAEGAVRASEERFRALVAASSEVLYRMSPDWSEMRQLRSGGFLADTEGPIRSWLQEYIPPEDQPRVTAAIKEAVERKGSFELEHRVRRADGSLGWTFSRAVPITDASGGIVEWFGAANDITGRKRMEQELRESEERFRVMADSSPVIMWVSDREGGNQFVNRTYREYFGVTYEQVQGGKWQPLLHPDDAHGYTEAVRDAVREQRSLVAQARVRRADGEWRWLVSQAEPRFSSGGEFLGHVGASLDVTDSKQAEDALREADRRKNEFMAVLSHELRNPLAPIRNCLYILDRAVPGGEQARRAHRTIDRQTAHLTRLVDDLLDVTRISRGKIILQRERLELCHLVRRTIEDHRSLFLRNEVALDVRLPDDGLWVSADATRLAQVIGNLLQNAAKFTGKGGKTEVAVEKDAAGHALIRVRDTGAGMSAEMLPRLFEPFAQADRTLDRSSGGLGLGLALVKGLVELHGGTVDARSEGVGAGAEFTVRLPLEPAAAGAGAASVPAHRVPSPRRRVLVIEDNVDAAESLKEVLALGGHEVAVAHDGPEGIARARGFQPDVVLCDIGLPGMDGYQVARALCAEAALRGVRLVALTGYAGPEDQQRAAEAGFDRHLAKPPSIEKLEEALAEARPRGAP